MCLRAKETIEQLKFTFQASADDVHHISKQVVALDSIKADIYLQKIAFGEDSFL